MSPRLPKDFINLRAKNHGLIHNHEPSTAPEQHTKYRKPSWLTLSKGISQISLELAWHHSPLSNTYKSKVASKGYTTRRSRIGRNGFKKTPRLRLLSLSLQQMKRTGLWNMGLMMTATVISSTPTIPQSSHILTLFSSTLRTESTSTTCQWFTLLVLLQQAKHSVSPSVSYLPKMISNTTLRQWCNWTG